MKKIELLAPVGNMECLVASVMAGADAVYLSGNKFGARAFSLNFSNDEIVDAINYCHLYGVKIYVAVNTLIYDNEIDEFIDFIDFIHRNNVDAIIIQDLGMFDLVRKTFPNLEIHISTQMHIHNLDGVKLMEKLGAKRVVLARETSIDDIALIKKNSHVALEVFIHGALCISYSGQCLMSSLIGGRSGNRGTCAGSCRLKYDVIDEAGNKINKDKYPLSTKDLNGIESVGKLIKMGVDSLKIEGRMKSKEYVFMVVSLYREVIDNYYKKKEIIINEDKLLKLKKIFNREYTRGFLGNAYNNDIINGFRPNHMGVEIGRVVDYNNNTVRIKLFDNISIGCGLRVISKDRDIGILVNDFYVNGKIVKEGVKGDIISLKINGRVNPSDKVVLTYDKKISDEVDYNITSNLRKVEITGRFVARLNERLSFMVCDGVNEVIVYGNIVDSAKSREIVVDEIDSKLRRLGNSVYKYRELVIDIDKNIFIPISEVNNIRRMAIDLLNKKRLYKIKYIKNSYDIDVPNFNKEKRLTCLVNHIGDIDKNNFDMIYSYCKGDNCLLKYPRVISKYPDNLENALVGEIGAFYKGKNLDTDFSFNVTNSYTVAFLHSLGARKVTLSYELTNEQVKKLLECYYKRYKKHPNVEVIVLGYEEVMVSKFSLNKYYQKSNLYLRDMFNNKYKIIERDNLMYIYNYKKRENYDEKLYSYGVNYLRINMDYND